MLRLTRAGAVVLPASPGFYHRPQRIEELIDFVVGRILDHVAVKNDMPRWSGGPDPT
jgi:4-hydroxy-3-polyprenylbenzoate decarboxylase